MENNKAYRYGPYHLPDNFDWLFENKFDELFRQGCVYCTGGKCSKCLLKLAKEKNDEGKSLLFDFLFEYKNVKNLYFQYKDKEGYYRKLAWFISDNLEEDEIISKEKDVKFKDAIDISFNIWILDYE